jgi:predicted benzoate:H+ symporter BenE
MTESVRRHLKLPEQPLQWLAGVLVVLSIVSAARAQDDDDQKRDLAKTEAVVLWTGLAIVSIAIVGVGLIWGVMRAAHRLLKKREPTHTEMPNIWYLNPPEKRKQDEP